MATLRRLANVDYSRDGTYFVTLCTHRRRRILWGRAREIVERELTKLPRRFPGMSMDCSNFLTNHVHAIFKLNGSESTLSSIVQCYKSITAREIKAAVNIDRGLAKRDGLESSHHGRSKLRPYTRR